MILGSCWDPFSLMLGPFCEQLWDNCWTIVGVILKNGREGQTEVVPATNNDEPPKDLIPYALGGTTDNNMPNDLNPSNAYCIDNSK